MTTIDIKQLKELAGKATPGPWKRGRTKLEHYILGPANRSIGDMDICTVSINNTENDAAFIAAANPQAILALCERVEALEASAKRYEFLRDSNNWIDDHPSGGSFWEILGEADCAAFDQIIDDKMNTDFDDPSNPNR